MNTPQDPAGSRLAPTPGSPSVVTCVYCGHEYIKVCEKHPMREAEARIERLRKALAGLIGAETKEELEAMEMVMRSVPGIEADKIAAINAIHALLSEANDQAVPNGEQAAPQTR